MCFTLATIVGIDPRFQFVGTQQTVRFRDGPLPMDPFRFNTHWSLEVCRLVASWCDVPYATKDLACGAQRRAFLSDPTHRHVFHFTPTHGSWLNQVELWCSVLARRFLKRGDFCSGEDFEAQLCTYLEGYKTHEAHPYRWTYTGQPLVRATPFSHTRRQQRQGRAWFSPRPPRFARALYPPRPYTYCISRRNFFGGKQLRRL